MILSKIKYPFAFMKALSMQEKGEYENSIKLLNKYEGFVNNNQEKFPDYFLILAEAYARIKKYKEADVKFKKALEVLEKSSYLTQDEKNYLKKYIYNWLIYLSSIYKHTLLLEKYKNIIENLSYDESKIRNSLKINFDIDIFNQIRGDES